jgi:hypothetical protein
MGAGFRKSPVYQLSFIVLDEVIQATPLQAAVPLFLAPREEEGGGE